MTTTTTIGRWQAFQVDTKPADGFPAPVGYTDLTPRLRDIVHGGVDSTVHGTLQLYVPHTTCTLVLNSGVDGTTLHDIRLFIEGSVPVDRPFVHLHDGPQDAAAHVRCVFGVQSLTVPVIDGELGIGHSQGVYLLEFDGPRDRTIQYAVSAFPS